MKKLLLAGFLFASATLYGEGFKVITLGSDGGVNDGNTSSYLIKGTKDENYLAFDAGTILSGIRKGLEKKSFSDLKIPADVEWTDEGYILREKIKGYFLSHAHLDHISGLVITSTEDTKKPIYGLDSTLETMKDSVFNWKLWPNFGNEGNGFSLGQYRYEKMIPGKLFDAEGTGLKVAAYPLSHSNYESTLFLIENKGDYLAYYGDVGPDKMEKSNQLENSFKVLAPLLKEKKLKGIMIEVSFKNSTPDNLLFGHLTPNWLSNELETLAKYAGKENMKGLNVIVTHIKPSLKKNENMREIIAKELEATNTLGVKYHFPVGGDAINF